MPPRSHLRGPVPAVKTPNKASARPRPTIAPGNRAPTSHSQRRLRKHWWQWMTAPSGPDSRHALCASISQHVQHCEPARAALFLRPRGCRILRLRCGPPPEPWRSIHHPPSGFPRTGGRAETLPSATLPEPLPHRRQEPNGDRRQIRRDNREGRLTCRAEKSWRARSSCYATGLHCTETSQPETFDSCTVRNFDACDDL